MASATGCAMTADATVDDVAPERWRQPWRSLRVRITVVATGGVRPGVRARRSRHPTGQRVAAGRPARRERAGDQLRRDEARRRCRRSRRRHPDVRVRRPARGARRRRQADRRAAGRGRGRHGQRRTTRSSRVDLGRSERRGGRRVARRAARPRRGPDPDGRPHARRAPTARQREAHHRHLAEPALPARAADRRRRRRHRVGRGRSSAAPGREAARPRSTRSATRRSAGASPSRGPRSEIDRLAADDERDARTTGGLVDPAAPVRVGRRSRAQDPVGHHPRHGRGRPSRSRTRLGRGHRSGPRIRATARSARRRPPHARPSSTRTWPRAPPPGGRSTSRTWR